MERSTTTKAAIEGNKRKAKDVQISYRLHFVIYTSNHKHIRNILGAEEALMGAANDTCQADDARLISLEYGITVPDEETGKAHLLDPYSVVHLCVLLLGKTAPESFIRDFQKRSTAALLSLPAFEKSPSIRTIWKANYYSADESTYSDEEAGRFLLRQKRAPTSAPAEVPERKRDKRKAAQKARHGRRRVTTMSDTL